MNNPYETHKPVSGGGIYFKPESGKPYKIRLVGEPVVFQNTYEDNATTRYAWVIWNHTDKEAQIFQLPPSGYREVYDLAMGEWGDPAEYDIAYKKTGERLETRHSVQPVKTSTDLTDDQLSACKLIDLKEAISKSTSASHVYYISEAEQSPDSQTEDEILNEIFPEG